MGLCLKSWIVYSLCLLTVEELNCVLTLFADCWRAELCTHFVFRLLKSWFMYSLCLLTVEELIWVLTLFSDCWRADLEYSLCFLTVEELIWALILFVDSHAMWCTQTSAPSLCSTTYTRLVGMACTLWLMKMWVLCPHFPMEGLCHPGFGYVFSNSSWYLIACELWTCSWTIHFFPFPYHCQECSLCIRPGSHYVFS